MAPDDENMLNQQQYTNDEETIEEVRQRWDVAQCIQNIKLHLFQTEEPEIEHTTEEAQNAYDKINAIPIGTRVDVNA
ncbi:hypothetical protein AAK894_07505 [Lachnospiraceae bacterium 46-61]